MGRLEALKEYFAQFFLVIFAYKILPNCFLRRNNIIKNEQTMLGK